MTGRSLRSSIWSRVGAVTIRTKIMGIVAVCILCSATAFVWYTYRDQTAALRDELQERGVAIASGLAAQSRDPILTNNQFLLYSLTRSTHNANKDLAYIFIQDADGSVLVHTFNQGFPTDLLNANPISPGDAYRIQALQIGDDVIQDIAVPVLGGKAGIVRLGMSEASIRSTVVQHIKDILLWVAMILILGLVVAYGLASILTRPISKMAEAARAVGKGDFHWKAPIWAHDEIGSLGAAFSEMTEELERKEKMRTQLLSKVITAQEEERKRIARELHDETGQSLTSLMVGLKYIEDMDGTSPMKGKIAELRALASGTLNEVHRLSVELRPSLLDDLGLEAAVERYCQEYSEKMDIHVDTEVSSLYDLRLPSETQVAVYRIIQEALTNIAKYAQAKNVSVILRYRDSSLTAIIEDDGRGFDAKSAASSSGRSRLGLFGMYERASLIGGKLTIESEPGSGTTVFLEVPAPGWKETRDGKDKITAG